MPTVKEITITLKDSEKSIKKKFLVYEELKASFDDPIIEQFLKEVRANFDGVPEKRDVKIKLLD